MTNEKILKTRLKQKHDIEANWLRAVNFTPMRGEIIVYDSEIDPETGETLELPEDRDYPNTHERIKVGDGITNVSELPFVGELELAGYATEGYVDQEVSDAEERLEAHFGENYVPKPTDTVGYDRVYVAAATGAQTTAAVYANSATGDSIVKRTADGRIKVTAPSDVWDATNKKYVDDAITTAASNIPDTSVKWSSANIRGSISPTEQAMVCSLSGNKLNFMDPTDIAIEYSHDNGSTWQTCGWADHNKLNLVTETDTQLNFFAHEMDKQNATNASTNHKLRITLTADVGKLYFSCKKFLIHFNTQGAQECEVLVEKATIGDPNTFTSAGTYGVAGWSGWNSVPFPYYFGGSDAQTSQVRKVRLTFYAKTITATTQKFSVIKLYALGETIWNGDPVAKNNSLFTYDTNKNATFPAQIDATDFTINGNSIEQRLANLQQNKAEVNGYKAAVGTVTIDDVSEVQHIMDVRVSNKNLIPVPYDSAADYGKELKGLVITEDNGVLVINGTATADGAFNFISPYVANPKTVPVDGTYTIKAISSTDTSKQYYLQPYFNGSSKAVVTNKDMTYTVTGELTRLTLFYKAGAVFDNVRVAAQLEKGEVSTEYVAPFDVGTLTLTRYGSSPTDNSATYTVNSNGRVSGVTSLYPSVTLMVDNSGAQIAVTYNSKNNNLLVHEPGESCTKVMSQKAVTDALAALREELLAAIQTGAQAAAEEIITTGEW